MNKIEKNKGLIKILKNRFPQGVPSRTKSTEQEFTYPELKQSDEYLKTLPSSLKRGSVVPGSEVEAFGEHRLQDLNFRKQLKRLQEKHGMTGYV